MDVAWRRDRVHPRSGGTTAGAKVSVAVAIGGVYRQALCAGVHRSRTMGLILLLVVLILVFGGGGFYYGPPYHYYGGGLGLVLLIVVLVLLFRR